MKRFNAIVTLMFVALIPLSVVGLPPDGATTAQPMYLLRYSVFKVAGLRPNQAHHSIGGASFMVRVPDLMGAGPCGDGPSMIDEGNGLEYRDSLKLHGTEFPVKADVFYSFKSTKGVEKQFGLDPYFVIDKKGVEIRSPGSVEMVTSSDGKYAMIISLGPYQASGK